MHKLSRNKFLLLLLVLCSCQPTGAKELPIYNPSDFNPKLVDQSLHHKNENHTVSDFKLINQNGKIITQEDYKDKVYVVDFFFTSCTSICPLMTNNLLRVQQEVLNTTDLMFLSMSVTPEMDSVSVLRKYATDKGIVDGKWHVTTGDKKHIYELARKSYFAVVEHGDGGLQDFIHTPNFILVDKKKQIRGIYDGTDALEIERLLKDLKTLLQ